MGRIHPGAVAASLAVLACAASVSVEPTLVRGEAALAAGEADDAADAFQSALALHPGDRRALLGLARSHIARGDGESALVVLAELEGADPAYFAHHAAADRELALVQAARSRLWRGDPAGALRLLAGVGPVTAATPGVRELRARARLVEAGRMQVAGRTEDAARLFRLATGREPGDDPVPPLAAALMAEGHLDTAISVLSDALLREPGDPRLVPLLERALAARYPDPLLAPPAGPAPPPDAATGPAPPPDPTEAAPSR